MLEVAIRFQKVVSLALGAHYGADSIFDEFPALKIATLVTNRKDLFSKDVAKRGHTIKWGGRIEVGGSDDKGLVSSSEEEDENKVSPVRGNGPASPENVLTLDNQASLLLSTIRLQSANRYTCDPEDLDDILQPAGKIARPQQANIFTWLGDVYKGSRGFELGSFDATIIENIWKKQSVNWTDLALGYISDIVSLVHSFIVTLLRACCIDEQVASGLLSVLIKDMLARYDIAVGHVKVSNDRTLAAPQITSLGLSLRLEVALKEMSFL